ncbi:alkaline phosphatase PhoX [Nevskia ramosa]|uniref:alkaline phosphatase PhoX n=1 Tax=Nevskia ramosa TaxID=64002 RepID=UPI003D0E7273
MQFDHRTGRWQRRSQHLDRRSVLRGGLLGLGLVAVGGGLASCQGGGSADGGTRGDGVGGRGALADLGPLSTTPDVNDLLLPAGFTARVIGRAGEAVLGTSFRWHTDPDGAAVFAKPDGGWVYVSNREHLPGGVNAIAFNAQGVIERAYEILPGALSRTNCGGGVTPWQTWFSGEEFDRGLIWECDPFGVAEPQNWPLLGRFKHEAATVDPAANIVYLTEDEPDGRFYRFLSDAPNIGGRADLSRGRLQALRILADAMLINTPGQGSRYPVEWLDIAEPNPRLGLLSSAVPTRKQQPDSFAFNGGEGIWQQRGVVYFSTKGDRRVWALDVAAQSLQVIYDDAAFATPPLTSVDNLVMTPGGDVIVAEDQNSEQMAVAIRPDGRFQPLVQLGPKHVGSEVTGPAFSPDGRFFYFSSQRGTSNLVGTDGVTYAVEGPWWTT